MTAFGKINRYRLYLVTAAVILLLDQLSKIWICHHPGLYFGAYWPHGGIEIIPGFFYLCFIGNEGAAWGLFRGFSAALAVLAVLALLAIYFYRRLLGLERKPVQLAFGAVTAGIIGNLIDRLRLGYVIDFLDFQLPLRLPVILESGRWPAFNIADIGITCGVLAYILLTWREPADQPHPLNQKRPER